jgi:phage tail-like protein
MPETGARGDPMLAFAFELRLDDLPPAGFSEVRGIEVEIEFKDYAEGGLHERPWRFPTRAKPATLTLKRGIVDRLLCDWCLELARGEVRFRDGTIVLRAADGLAAAVWTVSRALPGKWSGPDLDAGQSAVAMETLELVHRGLQRQT